MKSEESFKKWCEKKIKIDWNRSEKWVKNRQFWLFNIWVNVWWEMSVESPYIRPCMILKENLWWDMILIIPLSSKFWTWFIKNEFYKEIENFKEYWLNQKSYFILNQIKIISKDRLITQISWKQQDWTVFPKYSADLTTELKENLIKKIIK